MGIFGFVIILYYRNRTMNATIDSRKIPEFTIHNYLKWIVLLIIINLETRK